MNPGVTIICPEFIQWVKSRPCLVMEGCFGPTDPHHLIARGWRESKRNDFVAAPICRKHHGELEQIGPAKFEAKYFIDLWKSSTMLVIEFFAMDDERRAGCIIQLGGKVLEGPWGKRINL